jgi:hypothetical protein
MCWRSASDYDLDARATAKPARTTSKPARSLAEVVRALFRPRRPPVAPAETVPAEVVPFPAGGAVRTDEGVDREASRAA